MLRRPLAMPGGDWVSSELYTGNGEQPITSLISIEPVPSPKISQTRFRWTLRQAE